MGKATIRISLKTIAMLFPSSSAERIYLHGKWQQERGRNPSMRFGNHPTPRQAYAAVDETLGKYFDEIRNQHYSRQDFFWNNEMIADIKNRIPVCELHLCGPYR
jgi:hypothetical protein